MRKKLLFVWHILILFLMMSEKFDILCFRYRQNYLKFFYLFSCLVSLSYWTLICVFLAAFENIISEER